MIAVAYTLLRVGGTKVVLTGWGIFWGCVVVGAAKAKLTVAKDGDK